MSPRGGYEDEKVEGRRMKKYVQMDDPHCEHLGDAEVDEVLVSFCMQEDHPNKRVQS